MFPFEEERGVVITEGAEGLVRCRWSLISWPRWWSCEFHFVIIYGAANTKFFRVLFSEDNTIGWDLWRAIVKRSPNPINKITIKLVKTIKNNIFNILETDQRHVCRKNYWTLNKTGSRWWSCRKLLPAPHSQLSCCIIITGQHRAGKATETRSFTPRGWFDSEQKTQNSRSAAVVSVISGNLGASEWGKPESLPGRGCDPGSGSITPVD